MICSIDYLMGKLELRYTADERCANKLPMGSFKVALLVHLMRV